jgi:predicted metal-binding protein
MEHLAMGEKQLMTDYIQLARELGAESAVRFEAKDIAYDPRVILKCMFGCADYGKIHTCPYQKSPLSMDEYRAVFERYTWGVIIGCGDKHTSQRVSFEIERRCFLDGYYFAFSLSDCGLCKQCGRASHEPCRFPGKARPAFHSVGIDVFKTVRGLGLPIDVLRSEEDRQHWYSAVYVE